MSAFLKSLTVVLLLGSLILRSPPLFLAGVLLALVAGVTALWDRYALANVTYTRRLSQERVFAGDEVELDIEVTNAKPLPLAWLRVEDEFPVQIELQKGRLSYYHKPLRRLLTNTFSLRFYERARKRYHLVAGARGALEFGPAILRSGDIFGFKTEVKEWPAVDHLIVYPKVLSLRELGLPTAHPFGEATTRRRLVEDPLRFAGVRPYVPGDSLRRVHWKMTARHGELHSRVYEPRAGRISLIALNLRTVRDWGIISEYLELGISAAASVARHLLDAGDAVGLLANGRRRGDRDLLRIPPSRREETWSLMLESLAWLSELPFASFDRFLMSERPAMPYGATLVAISANPTSEDLAALLDIRDRGHPVTLLTIGESPPETAPEELNWKWIGGINTSHRLIGAPSGQTKRKGTKVGEEGEGPGFNGATNGEELGRDRVPLALA